jgi:signal transduction histidine kinase
VVRRVADETLTVLAASDAVSTDTILPLAGPHPAARAAASADLVVDDAHLHAPLGDHGVLSIDVSATDSSPPFRLLDRLAGHAATVLDRIARAADRRAAHRRCEALRAAGRALLGAESVQAGAIRAVEALAPLLPTPLRFCLCRLPARGEAASVVAASSPPLPGLAPGDAPTVDDRLRRLLDADTLRTLSDAPFSFPFEDALDRAGCRSALLVPLPVDAARGLLLLATEAEDAFGRAHHALAEEAAALFGDALRATAPPDGPESPTDPPSTTSAFLANLHHELRTPLTSIIGFAEVLDSESGGASDRFAALIARSGRRLQDTFDDLITLSQLEAGSRSLDPEPLSVSSQIQMAVDAAQDRAREAGLALSTEGLDRPVEAVLDRDGLHDILEALLDNALTFTASGGVTVRLRVDDTSLRVEVADTGVGMPPNRVPALFEPFRQAAPDDGPAPGGSGLGLALVQGWVDAMGGTVDVDTAPGAGTTVTVRLPR